jgi:hypothetical protein
MAWSESKAFATCVAPLRKIECCGGRMIVIETFEPALPATSPADCASGRNQDRYVMSTAATSNTRGAHPAPRWSPPATPALDRTGPRHHSRCRTHPRKPSSSVLKPTRSASPATAISQSLRSTILRPPSSSQSNPHSARHRPHFTSRGFVPWRLADAGPRPRGDVRDGPASATLHTLRPRYFRLDRSQWVAPIPATSASHLACSTA